MRRSEGFGGNSSCPLKNNRVFAHKRIVASSLEFIYRRRISFLGLYVTVHGSYRIRLDWACGIGSSLRPAAV